MGAGKAHPGKRLALFGDAIDNRAVVIRKRPAHEADHAPERIAADHRGTERALEMEVVGDQIIERAAFAGIPHPAVECGNEGVRAHQRPFFAMLALKSGSLFATQSTNLRIVGFASS